MPVAEIPSGRRRHLGGDFSVLRVLPAGHRQMVGPFIFLDQMGPLALRAGDGLDVRPHPHIGLATVTYLYEGQIRHRDSLGCVQDILPGDVNWMVAGRGIVHSERTAPEVRASGGRLLGLQCWVALPRPHEECEPSFHHHAAQTLPRLRRDGFELTLVAGTGFGLVSPVVVQSPLCHARLDLQSGARFVLGPEHEDLAVYLVEGALSVDERRLAPGDLAVLEPGTTAQLVATQAARAFVIGGTRHPEPRLVWWNFVASSEARLEQAKADWKAYGQPPFDVVPGDPEFIPLPAG